MRANATIRRRALALLAPALSLGAVAVIMLPSAHATPDVKIVRLGGSDRYATAAVLAEHAFPNGSAGAVIARGADFADGSPGFADALAANYVAGAVSSPILLTGDGTIPSATLQALQTLKVKNVILMGGTSAISNAAQAQLQSTPSTSSEGGDLDVARIAGPDRYATAADGAMTVPATYVRVFNGKRTALVARGDDFPDALAGGPLADGAQMPLLLTEPGVLSAPTAHALQVLDIQSVIILGGSAAVSDATEQQIDALGISTQRLAGLDRQQTAIAIADFAMQQLGFKRTIVDLARGDGYPDALAGGPEAATLGPLPIVLTGTPTDLSADTAAWLRAEDATLGEIDILGLQGAVSDAVAQEAAGSATCVEPTTTTTSPIGVLTTLLPATTAPPATGTTVPVCGGWTTTTSSSSSTTSSLAVTTTAAGSTTTRTCVSLPLVTTTLCV